MVKNVSYERFSKYIGGMFCKERVHLGLTQEQVAQKLQLLGFDLGQSSISKIEKGERNIYFPELCALLNIYAIPLQDFGKYIYTIILSGKAAGWMVQ